MPKMQMCANCGHRYPAKDQRCPECATHMPRGTQLGDRCVEIADAKGGKHLSYFVPGGTCEWRAGEQRCKFPASMSSATDGSGPWYCSAHADCQDPVAGSDYVEASQDYDKAGIARSKQLHEQKAAAAYCQAHGLTTQADMVAHMRQSLGRIGNRPGNLDWAHRIMARIAAGESLPMIAEEKARKALGLTDQRTADLDAL